MTQAELARLAGVHPDTVSHIVRGGHCSTDTLEKIAARARRGPRRAVRRPGGRADRRSSSATGWSAPCCASCPAPSRTPVAPGAAPERQKRRPPQPQAGHRREAALRRALSRSAASPYHFSSNSASTYSSAENGTRSSIALADARRSGSAASGRARSPPPRRPWPCRRAWRGRCR